MLTNNNIIYYTYLLFQNGWGSEKNKVTPNFDFNAPNLLYFGIKKLMGDKLAAFNQKIIRPNNVLNQTDIKKAGKYMEKGNNKPNGLNISGMINIKKKLVYKMYAKLDKEKV